MTSSGHFDLVQSHERIDCCDVYRAGDGVHAQWLEHRSRLLPAWKRAALRANAYHRYVLDAERRTFSSPRLRAVICNSVMVRDEIRRWFGTDASKLHVIYNGVDLEHFHPRLKREHRAEVRDRLGLADGTPLITFVGSGFERKGLGPLIEALARVKSTHLAVVGKDGDQPKLASLASRFGVDSRIHWVGPQADVRPWYGAADAFALPTFYDPFPNAVLEALACGLPVLTSRSCGAAELVHAGVNGVVCDDPSDIDSLAAALSDLLVDPARLSAAARASAQPLGLPAMADSLLALYRRLLGG
jgi:UDP-glucose:(heptosyl)LPS alpha-1,3-glucosyltransferase